MIISSWRSVRYGFNSISSYEMKTLKIDHPWEITLFIANTHTHTHKRIRCNNSTVIVSTQAKTEKKIMRANNFSRNGFRLPLLNKNVLDLARSLAHSLSKSTCVCCICVCRHLKRIQFMYSPSYNSVYFRMQNTLSSIIGAIHLLYKLSTNPPHTNTRTLTASDTCAKNGKITFASFPRKKRRRKKPKLC